MDTLEAIRTRRSIRAFHATPVSHELVRKIVAAAMMAPSARNAQPWRFYVIDQQEQLDKIPRINPYARMASHAPVAILVCGDTQLEISEGFWPVDCAAAVQNLLLATHSLGLGAVWTGVYPRQSRVDDFREMLDLPAHIIPHSLIPIGYPAEQPTSETRYDENRVIYTKTRTSEDGNRE